MIHPREGFRASPEVEPLEAGISVVIPVYNSEKTLPVLVDQLSRLLQRRGERFEIVLVNDCSKDGSWQVIETLSSTNGAVRGIDLMRNYGQHNALLCGIRTARYEVVVTMDDDLQHPPEEVPKLLEKLGEGYDVVYGSPLEMPHELWRNLASSITKIVLRGAMGARTARRMSAFRAFRTSLRQAFDDYRSPYLSIDVLLTWGTTRFTHVLVRHDPRRIGQSNYTLRKLFTHALNMVTGFSTLPLKVATILGFMFMLFGVFILGLVLVRVLVDHSTPQGFPFLASIIAIFSGIQLFALGMIGEYLARVHIRLMDRPSFAVRQTTPSRKSASRAA